MKNIVYVVAVLLVIGWLLGNFVFHLGAVIHVLLVIAIVIIIFRIMTGRKTL